MNGATVISIDESILPSGYSDTVVVEGNRNIESEINSGLEREDANQATPNLHTSTVQLPEELQSDQLKRERLFHEVPGSLNAIRFTRHLHLSGAKMMKEVQ